MIAVDKSFTKLILGFTELKLLSKLLVDLYDVEIRKYQENEFKLTTFKFYSIERVILEVSVQLESTFADLSLSRYKITKVPPSFLSSPPLLGKIVEFSARYLFFTLAQNVISKGA